MHRMGDDQIIAGEENFREAIRLAESPGGRPTRTPASASGWRRIRATWETPWPTPPARRSRAPAPSGGRNTPVGSWRMVRARGTAARSRSASASSVCSSRRRPVRRGRTRPPRGGRSSKARRGMPGNGPIRDAPRLLSKASTTSFYEDARCIRRARQSALSGSVRVSRAGVFAAAPGNAILGHQLAAAGNSAPPSTAGAGRHLAWV